MRSLWAMEYDPNANAEHPGRESADHGSFYYMVSVRRQVLGDDLNADFTPTGFRPKGS
ncbi:MAG: hypothetical protein MPW14_21140 [Candidatus Manganitrophus sp.]|nr:MAG: hypothetical protein MPW14_21140 [Candidatus Manganitrophus sp.]